MNGGGLELGVKGGYSACAPKERNPGRWLGDNDRKDGREREDDMQPEVAGNLSTQSMSYEPLLA